MFQDYYLQLSYLKQQTKYYNENHLVKGFEPGEKVLLRGLNIRKLASDMTHKCEAPSGKRKNCALCSKNAHPCERDTTVSAIQSAVRMHAILSNSDNVARALNV